MGEGRRRLAVAVALAVVGAACTGGGGGKAAPQTTSAAPSTSTTAGVTTTTLDPTKSAILAAYRAEWADVLAVDTVFPVRPLDPRLASHASGKQLLAVRQALTQLSVMSHYERGSTEFAPVVTSIAGDTATVRDCIFDQSVEVDYRTNLPVETPNIGHTLDSFTLTRINGQWFVTDSTVIGSGKTGDACTP
jgi:hypothetical protein